MRREKRGKGIGKGAERRKIGRGERGGKRDQRRKTVGEGEGKGRRKGGKRMNRGKGEREERRKNKELAI